MTDRIQLAAEIDRLIYGNDTAFDAEDARALDRLLLDEVRALRLCCGTSVVFQQYSEHASAATTQRGPLAPIVGAALSRDGLSLLSNAGKTASDSPSHKRGGFPTGRGRS